MQRVVHEVQRSHLVNGIRCQQGLMLASDNPFLGSWRQVRLHTAMHLIRALIVPSMTLIVQTLEALPEIPAGMPLDRIIQRSHHRRITLDPICSF
jgi:hypothetical protein